jgi:hypothetical protein
LDIARSENIVLLCGWAGVGLIIMKKRIFVDYAQNDICSHKKRAKDPVGWSNQEVKNTRRVLDIIKGLW